MVNYYLTIMQREEMSAVEAEQYLKTKVSIIWRKQVREQWEKLTSEKEATEGHSNE